MAGGMSPEERLAAAIAAKSPQVRLERCAGSLEKVFARALQKDPRLLAFLESWEASYQKTGLVQIFYTYDVTLRCREDAPEKLEDVLTDADRPGPEEMLRRPLVTADPERHLKVLREKAASLGASLEGSCGWEGSQMGFEGISPCQLIRIRPKFMADPQTLSGYKSRASFEAKRIWKQILGRACAPAFVRPFLALSWLMQECRYDHAAYDAAAADPEAMPDDPVPHLAYGPLVERRGICAGVAWAFYYLMREAGIECRCVSGTLKERDAIGHMWNLVRLDGMYYHVDATISLGEEGVYLGGLMKTDEEFARTHTWDRQSVPVAKGRRFTHAFVEEYLYENGGPWVDEGADEKYLYPEDIYE